MALGSFSCSTFYRAKKSAPSCAGIGAAWVVGGAAADGGAVGGAAEGGAAVGGGRSRKTDSHRFATLLVQLYTDRTTKGTLASIINVMVRNPKVGRRLPFFRDNRRGRSSPVFNAWRDSDMPTNTADTLRPAGVGGAGRRPKKKGGRMGKGGAGGAGGAGGKEKPDRAPLADLLEEIIPLFRRLKRTRNALRFPPPPPYPTLPEPATHTVVRVDDPAVRTGLAPQLSDYSCAQRTLSPVSEADVINLCTAVGYGSGSGSGSGKGGGGLGGAYNGRGNVVEIETVVELASFVDGGSGGYDGPSTRPGTGLDTGLGAGSPDPPLVVVDFFSDHCAPCVAMAPVFRALAEATPTVVFLKVNLDVNDDLARHYNITSLPTFKLFRSARSARSARSLSSSPIAALARAASSCA